MLSTAGSAIPAANAASNPFSAVSSANPTLPKSSGEAGFKAWLQTLSDQKASPVDTASLAGQKSGSTGAPVPNGGKRAEPEAKKLETKDKNDQTSDIASPIQLTPLPQQPLTLLTMLGFGQTNTPPLSISGQELPAQLGSAGTKQAGPKITLSSDGKKVTPGQEPTQYSSLKIPGISAPLQANGASAASAGNDANLSSTLESVVQSVPNHSDADEVAPEKDGPRAQAAGGNLAFALRLNNPAPDTTQTAPVQAIATTTTLAQNFRGGSQEGFGPGPDQKPASAHSDSSVSDLSALPFSSAYVEAANAQATGTKPADSPAASKPTDIDPQPESIPQNTVNNVHLHLTGDNNQRVDVRLVDYNGELRVSVRTGDTNLAQSLQERMPELTSRLDTQHFRSEIWTPSIAGATKTETNGSSFSGANAGGSANYGDNTGRQGNSRGQNGNSNQPDWLDEIEGFSTSAAASRRTQIWLQ